MDEKGRREDAPGSAPLHGTRHADGMVPTLSPDGPATPPNAGAALSRAPRPLAGLGSAGSLVAGLWVAALALIYTSYFRSPNPDPSLDGDPCCAHPDTWWDVVMGGAYFLAVATVAVGLALLTTTLASVALTGTQPAFLRGRRAATRAFAAACLVCAVGVPTSWALAGGPG
jgi:hypothetical protein